MRHLLIQGRQTSLRLTLPAFGQVSVGRSIENQVLVEEPGVEEKHLVLHLEQNVRAELIAGEATLSSGQALVIGEPHPLDDALIMGAVEISVIASGAPSRERHCWSASSFERLVDDVIGQGFAVLLASLERVPDVPDEIELADLGDQTYACLVPAEQLGSVTEQLIRSHPGITIGTAAEHRDARSLLEAARQRMRPAESRAAIIAESGEMRRLVQLADQVAQSNSIALILGETGTGKNLLAERIHARSGSTQPMVRVSCVHLNDLSDKEAPDFVTTGTVLLDEVGGLSPRAQLALSYILERHASTTRFLATSNQDLNGAVAQGTFRKDLLFRLNPVTLTVPPLRQRKADIQPLAEQFLAQAATRSEVPRLSPDALKRLQSYDWPGNVRQLKNVMERALIVCGSSELSPEHLSLDLARSEPEEVTDEPGALSLREEIAALERKRILEALEQHGNQAAAAKALDIPIRTFMNRMDALGIPRGRKPK